MTTNQPPGPKTRHPPVRPEPEGFKDGHVLPEDAPAPDREAIARIIDPEAWERWETVRVHYTIIDSLKKADAILALSPGEGGVDTFQARVQPWMMACFGPEISADRMERNHRFIEEALELVQANGCTQDEAHQLVDYVYGRPVGEVNQEVGGVMVTLAALCLASGQDMHAAAETELARIWTKVETIRAKQAAKPKHSPLPEALSALHPVEAAEGWRPIETAPDDGSDVLVIGGRHTKATILSADGEWWRRKGAVMPTHWRPLPSPPSGLKPSLEEGE